MAGIDEIDIGMQNLIKMTNAKVALTKLWENASWTSAFANQKITLDLSGYDYVMVIFNQNTSSNTRMTPPIISPAANGGGIINAADGSRRYFTNNYTFVNFDTVYPANGTANCIPLFVYGIKLSGGVRLKTYLQRLKTLLRYFARRCLLWQLA